MDDVRRRDRVKIRRPWPVTAATISVAGVLIGLLLWIVYIIEDVWRLDREASTLGDRFDGSDGPFFYTLYSLVCTAVFAGLGLLTTAAAGWLFWRGRRVSLAATTLLLAATAVLIGMPCSVVTAVTLAAGPSGRQIDADMSFDDALTVLHTANTPVWTMVIAALGSALTVFGSPAAILLLLSRPSRRYFTNR